ncbi:MAG: helix-turn-helix domain-containing protein [Clostridia bacterium]|nr:helix-turn-helix domain-containing protein [Clostridia bacterium]
MYKETVNPCGEIPIFHSEFLCEEVYSPEDVLCSLSSDKNIEVNMVVEGEGIHCVFDQVIPCNVGDIYIMPPHTPHAFFVPDEKLQLKIRRLSFNINDWFDGDVAAQDHPNFCYGIFNDNAVAAYAMLNDYTQKKIASLFDDIEYEISKTKNNWADAIRSYLSIMFIIIGRYINTTIKNTSSNSSKGWNIVISAIKYIRKNFSQTTLTLSSIAGALYISESHLSRLFKGLTGKSFSEYLRDIRLEHACKLLRETDMKVGEIVTACGLSDVYTFYKNFTLRYHMTPHEYRKSNSPIKNKIISKGEILMSILNDISANLQIGKAKIVAELVQQAIDEGSNPEQILNEGLLAGMSIIGEKFKNGEVFVPEVLVAARAMNKGTQVLKPYLAQSNVTPNGKACIGTIQGDLHDIGKNLVKMMMEGKGIEVIDLGTDVAPSTFVQTAIEQNCQIICCSALLTTTMWGMEEVVKEAEKAGIRDKVKIMIGGAPVNEDFCCQIGADCYTPDAASAADAAIAFCKA